MSLQLRFDRLKRGIALVSACIVLACVCTCSVNAASAYPKPTDAFFVNDFAKILKVDATQTMQQAGEALDKATTAQVVAVTVQNMGGADLESYSIGLAREWGIGSGEKNNGVLLLLAVEERQVRIEVGSGLEGRLNDAKTGRIIDTYGYESLKNNDFSTGMAAIYSALVNEVYIEYDMKPADGYDAEATEDNISFFDIARIVVIILIVVLSLVFSGRGRGGRGGRGGFLPFFFFGGPGGSGHSGGGGFGGGFGGGGGFSGGGGGFSGGGSSRGF